MVAVSLALAIPREEAVRPGRIASTSFEAFMISAPCQPAWDKGAPVQRTYALGQIEADNVDSALAAALTDFAFSHKQQLVIRETGARGILLHVYAIVKKPDVWVYRDYHQVREQRLGAKFLCIIDGGVVL